MSVEEDRAFKKKLIDELHDISLSLREISGRNIVDNKSDRKDKTYAERYFTRSIVTTKDK